MPKKLTWLGYNRLQVDLHLEQLAAQQRKTLEQMSAEVGQFRHEESLMVDRIRSMEAEVQELTQRRPAVELGQATLQLVLNYIEQMAAEEVVKIQQRAREQGLQHSLAEERIIDRQAKMKEQIAQLIGELIHVEEKRQANPVEQPAPPQAERRSRLYLVDQAVGVSLAKDDLLAPTEAQRQVAAGAAPPNAPSQSPASSMREAFWGGAVPLTQVPLPEDQPVTADLPAADGGSTDQHTETPVMTSDQAPAAKSAETKLETNNTRHRFLIGKIAGEDLLDGSGALIIKKHAVITAEVAQRAEDEGKLAELIIQMLLPGMETLP